jgi:hypothetical protein
MADAVPNICRRLFLALLVSPKVLLGVEGSGVYVVSGLRLPELDSFRREGLDVSGGIDEACASRARTNIDSYVVILHRRGMSIEMRNRVKSREGKDPIEVTTTVHKWKGCNIETHIVLELEYVTSTVKSHFFVRIIGQ